MSKRPGHDLYFSLPKDWKEKAGEMFSQGCSDVEVHVSLGITATEHAILLKQPDYHEEFFNGMAKAEAFWHEWARKNMVVDKDTKVNTKIFETFMERLFKWSKKESSKNKEDKKDRTKGEVKSFEDRYLSRAK